MKMEIDYTGLSIYLLGQHRKEIFNSEETDLEKLSRGVISIEGEEYFANVRMQDCFISLNLLEDHEIFSILEKNLIYPVKEKVTKDLEEVKGQLNKLRVLVKEGKLSDYIDIKKKFNEFRFYDCFLGNPSEQILNRVEKGAVNLENISKLAGYRDLAEFIGRSNSWKVPYFKGKTLEDALKRGLMIQEFIDNDNDKID